MISGAINPSQLEIVREILHSGGFNYDTAVFRDVRANYTVSTAEDGTTTVTHNVAGGDGIRPPHRHRAAAVRRRSRSTFPAEAATRARRASSAILDADGNPAGTPVTGQLLRVSAAGVTDANNTATAARSPARSPMYGRSSSSPARGSSATSRPSSPENPRARPARPSRVTPEAGGPIAARDGDLCRPARRARDGVLRADRAGHRIAGGGRRQQRRHDDCRGRPRPDVAASRLRWPAPTPICSRSARPASFRSSFRRASQDGGDNLFDVTVSVTDGVDTETSALQVSVADPAAEGPAAPHDVAGQRRNGWLPADPRRPRLHPRADQDLRAPRGAARV